MSRWLKIRGPDSLLIDEAVNLYNSQERIASSEVGPGVILKEINIGPKGKEVEVVLETQLDPPVQKATGPLKVQRGRNPNVGKNSQAGRSKEIKVLARKNFKKNVASTTKRPGKLDDYASKVIKEQILKSKKDEEKCILDLKKQIQINQ